MSNFVEPCKFIYLKDYKPSAQPEFKNHEDWNAIVPAFDDMLLTIGTEVLYAGFPQAVIGLFGNAGQLLRAWAEKHGAKILESPKAEMLLSGDAELWPELQNPGNDIFVIPSLERCFLRHYRGINFARQLVETIWEKPCRLLIGCDAWSWQYLQQAVQIDALCSDVFTATLLMAYPAPDNDINIAPRSKNLRMQAYVLHTLLVHNGVAASILPKLLPFHFTEILKTLADLREQNLVINDGGIWSVKLQHYLAVRNQLAKAEFWISDK